MDNSRKDQNPGEHGPNGPHGPDQYGQDQYGRQPGYGAPDQHGQHPGYGTPDQYGQHPGYGPGYGSEQGEKHKRNSIILGVVGLFLLGIVLGPLALWQAGKAQALGVRATAGKVLGWIDLVFGILGLFALMSGGVPA